MSQNVQAGPVTELVVYALEPSASREAFLAASRALDGWIARQPGFVARELLHDPEAGTWADVVRWRSRAEALAAGARAVQCAECTGMFSLIASGSVRMMHGHPVG